jgi:hypothetical protein
MIKRYIHFSLALVLIVFSSSTLIAQYEAKSKEEFKDFYSWEIDGGTFYRIKHPLLIYGKENDGFPDKIKTKGTIVDIDLPQVVCGHRGGVAGTVKVWIDEKVEGYDHEYIYLIVSCLSSNSKDKFLNKQIEFEAEKLTKFPYQSSYSLVNSFNSGGVPFYLMKNSDVLRKSGEKFELKIQQKQDSNK